MSGDLTASWDAAALAAVAVRDGEGQVHLEPVVPLVNGRAGILLSYDRTQLARWLDGSGRAVLATWDSRLALRGWEPLAADVEVEVVDDRDGRWIEEGWLVPLLRTHPPSRTRLDTPLLRREHWWYVPRWVVTVSTTHRVWPLGRRASQKVGLLAWEAESTGIDALTAEVEDWHADPVRLRPLTEREHAAPDGAPAALLARDVRLPDLDDEAVLRVRGRIEGAELRVSARDGRPSLGRPPSLWRRLQDVRALERACRAHLEAG